VEEHQCSWGRGSVQGEFENYGIWCSYCLWPHLLIQRDILVLGWKV